VAANRARFEAALHQGHAYCWDQRWEEAIGAFRTALQEAAHEPSAYAGLGMAHLELNQLEAALAHYKLAARYARGEIIYLRQVAEVQEQMGQRHEAGKTYLAMGEMALQKGRPQEARDHWHHAARLAPELLHAQLRLAAFYREQKMIPSAIQAYLQIARIQLAQGNRAQALATCRQALDLDPRNAAVLTALELLQQGRADAFGAPDERMRTTAVDAPRAATPPALGAAPAPVRAAQRYALAELAEQLFAAESAPAAPDGNARPRRAHISQALDYQTRGLPAEATAAYEQALALGANDVAIRFNLGVLYLEQQRYEQAVRTLETAVAAPDYKLAGHLALGQAFHARGQLKEAITHLTTALRTIDLNTVDASQAARVTELYDQLLHDLLALDKTVQANAFARALLAFVDDAAWQAKAQAARARLDAIARAGMMILGDVLISGAEQVLESLYLSREYAQRGLFNSAMEETYRSIQLAPTYLPAHIRLAELLVEQDRDAAAAEKYVTIADAYRARGDANGALLTYTRAVELAPLNVNVRQRFIDLLRQLGQIEQTLEQFLSLGQAHAQLGRPDAAREAYTQALTLTGQSAAAERWRAQLLRLTAAIDVARQDWRAALAAYQQLRQLTPQAEDVALALVDLYFTLRQPSQALQTLDQHLGTLARRGDAAQVGAVLEALVAQRPLEAALVYRLSRLYAHQRRTAEAVGLLDRLGEAQIAAGQHDKAIQTVERIMALNPPNRAEYAQMHAQLHAER